MIGLEYVRKQNGDTVEALATKLGITKSLISQWENGRKPIPSKRLIQLSELYGLPEKYFNKELNKSDQLKIQLKKLSSQYDDSVVEDEVPIDFDENGKPIEYEPVVYGDRGTAEAIRSTEFDIKVEQFTEKVKNVIYNNNINYDDEQQTIDNIIDTQETNLGLIKKFVSLMKDNDSMFLAYILRAIELSEEDGDAWGEIPKLDRNGLTGKLLAVIKEWKEAEQKRREVEYQEYKELFGLNDE
ncbi:MAG: helix-turn-helix domain-containing protein [Oscillospiraceae bacterium]